MRRGPNEPPASRLPNRRTGGFISVGLVLAMSVGLVGTVLGVGATSRSLDVSDGNIWLWSSKPGQVSRVNANSGRVDENQPLTDSRGHRVQVTQNDKYLLLHDLDTGKVTSVDLTRMGFTGSLKVDRGSGVRVALSGDRAALIDQRSGEIRGFDPGTMRATSAKVQLPAPLAGGDFDASGRLWVGVPSQGTVASVAVSGSSAKVTRTESATQPGHPMAVSVLDHGVLAADTSGRDIAVVTDTVTTVTAPEPLTGATVPARTVGGLAVVTLPRSGRLLPVGLSAPTRPRGFDLPDGVTPDAATPFSGRIYVPDAKHHQVLVFSRSGKNLGTLGLAGAQGPLELQVREDHLTINAPDAAVARVVDPDGVTRVVDKYRTDVPGGDGDLSVIAAPAPGDKGKHGGSGGKGDSGNGTGKGRQQTGPPSPPIPVTAEAGDHEVSLSWPEPASNGAPVQRYEVSWAGGHRTFGAGTRSTSITGLHNGQTYSFAVTATNRYGTSPQALSDRVTPGGATPDVPQQVHASVSGKGQVTVTWGKADQARDYVVKPSGGGGEQVVNTTSATFDSLTGGQSYTFTVTARSSNGRASDPSRPSNAVTPFGVPAAPEQVQIKQTATNQWTVTWQPGSDNGSAITGYQVRGGASQDISDPKVHRAVVSSGTGITVAAVNKAGVGEAATASQTAPDPPTVTAVNVTQTSTSISAQATATGVGVQNCTLSAEGAGSVTGSCGSLTLTSGVRASTKYTVSVVAHNAGGDSKPFTTSATTSTVTGTVSCTNDPSTDDPHYCDTGIGTYPGPQQQGGGTKVATGSTQTALCQATGQTIDAKTFNNGKRSDVWVMLDSGRYIPFAWFTVDLSKLNTCG